MALTTTKLWWMKEKWLQYISQKDKLARGKTMLKCTCAMNMQAILTNIVVLKPNSTSV